MKFPHTVFFFVDVLFAKYDSKLTKFFLDPSKKYHLVLVASKEKKVRAANNKSFDLDIKSIDVYDELLTQEEIQSHIDKINQLLALERVEGNQQKFSEKCSIFSHMFLFILECVKSKDLEGLHYALNAKHLSLESMIKGSMMSKYLIELERRLRGGTRGNDGLNFLRRDDVENAVSQVNLQVSSSNLRDQAVKKVNVALERQDPDVLVENLQEPILGLTEFIHTFAATLYLEELNYVREGCQSDIRFEGIKKLCEFLSLIAKLNDSVERFDRMQFLNIATNSNANLEDVIDANVERYLDAMQRSLLEKKKGAFKQLLNHGDIQEIIDQVNNTIGNGLSLQKIEAVRKVNEAVEKCDAPKLKAALLDSDLMLAEELDKERELDQDLLAIGDDDAVHLLCLLRDLKANLSVAENEDHELWMNHIVETVEIGLSHGREAKRAGTALAIVNMAIMQGDANHTFQTLLHEDLNVHSRLQDKPNYIEKYQKELERLASGKESFRNPWVVHTLNDGDKVYLNLQDHSIAWRTPSDYRLKCQYISVPEIDEVIADVNEEVDERHKIEVSIVRLQARARGFLVRQRLFGMLQHYYENEANIIKIQALWRGRRVRRRYGREITKMKSKSLAYYKKHENHVKLIQRVWRAKLAKKEFRKLLESNNVHKNMDIPTVRKFLHLLDMSPEDFSKELELQNLKGEITKKIRMVQGFEKDLDTMDIKIGLLVKNRIDVEEVVAHGRHLNRRVKDRQRLPSSGSSSGTLVKGLKALKKESREKFAAI